MRRTQSDAYYLAQLLDRLDHLVQTLSNKLSAQATLTERAQKLHQELKTLLLQKDEVVQDMLEYSLLPKINHLLLDAIQQLKLKRHTQRAGMTLSKATKREQLLQEKLKGPPAHPHPPLYHPIPKPQYSADRQALIEDALNRLKMLLSTP